MDRSCELAPYSARRDWRPCCQSRSSGWRRWPASRYEHTPRGQGRAGGRAGKEELAVWVAAEREPHVGCYTTTTSRNVTQLLLRFLFLGPAFLYFKSSWVFAACVAIIGGSVRGLTTALLLRDLAVREARASNSEQPMMGSGGRRGREFLVLQNRCSASLAMSRDGSFPSRPRQSQIRDGAFAPLRLSCMSQRNQSSAFRIIRANRSGRAALYPRTSASGNEKSAVRRLRSAATASPVKICGDSYQCHRHEFHLHLGRGAHRWSGRDNYV